MRRDFYLCCTFLLSSTRFKQSESFDTNHELISSAFLAGTGAGRGVASIRAADLVNATSLAVEFEWYGLKMKLNGNPTSKSAAPSISSKSSCDSETLKASMLALRCLTLRCPTIGKTFGVLWKTYARA